MSLHIQNCTDIKSSHTDTSTLGCLSIAMLHTIESFEVKYNHQAGDWEVPLINLWVGKM